MSAWVVSDNHVRLLAQAQALYGDGSVTDLDELCSLLIAENVASVNYRYPHREPEIATPIDYHPVIRGEKPTEFKWLALKAVDCYSYQSCEHPEWEASEAKRITDALEQKLLYELYITRDQAYSHSRYGAQPWGFA